MSFWDVHHRVIIFLIRPNRISKRGPFIERLGVYLSKEMIYLSNLSFLHILSLLRILSLFLCVVVCVPS